MFNRRTIVTLSLLFVTGAVGCQKPSPPAVGTSSARTPSAIAEVSPRQTQPPVSPTDPQAALLRTYNDAVTIDDSRQDSFVTGDFNGDGSEDIAVVVKPRSDKLSDLNSELANWTLEDPVRVGIRVEQMGAHKLAENSAPVRVGNQEVLLALIHGYRENGWRDSRAMQTYLLKNAVSETMRTEARTRDTAPPRNQVPSSRGDVIRETRGDTTGFIYWTGANYAWHAEAVKR